MLALLRHALEYAEWGWRVLPLHSITQNGWCSCYKKSCASPGKHPRTLHGVKDASTDEWQIRTWWRMWPDANIGLAAGALSDLVVIDIDPRNGGADSVKELIDEYGTLPHTVIAHTGGAGFHFLFRYPTPTGIAKRVLADGVDLVSDGGYIVAPPSNHVSGGEYRWAMGHNPSKIPLSELPAWVLARLPTYTSSEGFEVGRFVPKGGRNSHFTRIAGSMRRWGMSQDAIGAALFIHNNEVCNPPMHSGEIDHIVRSVCRYEPDYHGDEKPKEGSSIRVEDCSLDEGPDGS